MNWKPLFLAGVFAFLIALAGVSALYADDNGGGNNGNPNKSGTGIGDIRLGF
jgi:hypothetical protein